MKYPRITTPNRPAALPPFTAIEELDLGDGLYCRVSITRGQADPRQLAEHQANVEHLVTIIKKAQQIDALGNLVARPDGLASGTRTTSETVDTTAIVAGSQTWRPGWVRVSTPAGVNWNAEHLPEGCVAVENLPTVTAIGDQVYLDPFVYRYDAGIIATAADAKGDEMLWIIRNSAQLVGTEF